VILGIELTLVGGLLLASAPRASSPAQPAASTAVSFDKLARRANEAREAGRLEEATALCREALRLRPKWAEGWWYVGAMAYERDRFAECIDAFRRLVALQPQAAPAWALRGLCAFQTQQYAAARRHLEKALTVGPLEDEKIARVVVFHRALLLIRDGEFEPALAPLTQLLQTQTETPELVEACGLVLLRRAALPAEIPPSSRELVQEAGRAYCAHLARKGDQARERFEKLLARYPRERHLHYGYGLSLAQQGSPEAAAQYRTEIELFPDHVLAHLELAFTLLTRGQAQEAMAPAETAARLAPGLFAAHLALGRALVATGGLERGIRELETAVRLAPDIPEPYLTLSRAYAQAGRRTEADRANAVFQALEKARRTGAGGSPPGPRPGPSR
jgi:tetratricopeptide (TPR) repeat protein